MKSLKAQLLSALVVMWIGLLALAAWSAFSARGPKSNFLGISSSLPRRSCNPIPLIGADH